MTSLVNMVTNSAQSQVSFEAKRGVIEKCTINRVETESPTLIGASVHDISDWGARLAQAGLTAADAGKLGAWMEGVLGTQFTTPIGR